MICLQINLLFDFIMFSKIQRVSLLISFIILFVMMSLIAVHSAIVAFVFPIGIQVKSLGVYRGVVAGGIGVIVNSLGFIILRPSTTTEDWLLTTLLLLGAGILVTHHLIHSQENNSQATQLNRFKEELSQNRKQLEIFRTALPDRVFIFDENGYYVDVISQVIAPARREYLIGRHVTDTSEVLKLEESKKIMNVIRETLKTGESQALEYQAFTSKEKIWLWLEGRSSLLRPTNDSQPLVIWLSRDITKRKQTEENLKKVQSLAQIGTWETDVQANYVKWSDEMYAIYGITYTDFDHTVEFVTARIHPEDLVAFQDKILNGENPYPTEYRIIRPDNTCRTVFAVGEAIYDEAGQIIRRIGLLQDITDRKQAEQDRVQLLSEQQHSWTLSNLISNVTHDIMSPLTIIKTSLYILNQTDDAEKQRKHLDQVRVRVDMLQKLFENLLKLSFLTNAKLNDLDPREVNIISLLRSLSQQYNELIQQKNQTLAVDLPDQNIILLLDEEYMWQAISNILQNAMQYTPSGGHISLSLTDHPMHLIITITDNGKGISSDHQSNMAVPDLKPIRIW
jgi:PAS domain S-box-containing protein